ncbi:GlsB/YeaQ/YmgE family stress response membrane protein [Calidifontibacter indicus]|uniref:Transglycosylase associated protein n=1 Tax=Calidifontibacter indicus TaxID=419650 RepID=A0A3D9URK5_9MICO|nr:GlsB/YeaQ/YmgE family stress response membrane protein [Calidifontibacter indicus]REF31947.1 transglycosylase associated protein [Calidifontibacter indicus]
MLWNILMWILGGAVVGILARAVLPGKQNISIAATVILGILGAVVGGFIANAIGVGDTNGIDWIKLIISVIVAAAAVTVYGSIAGKKV